MSTSNGEPMDVDEDASNATENISSVSNGPSNSTKDTEMKDVDDASPKKDIPGNEGSEEQNPEPDASANTSPNEKQEETPKKDASPEKKSVTDVPSEDLRRVIFAEFEDPDEGLTRRVIYDKLVEHLGFKVEEWKATRKQEIKDIIAEAQKMYEEQQSDEDEDDKGSELEEDQPPPTKKRKSSTKKEKSRKRRRDEDDEEDSSPPKKRRRKSKKRTDHTDDEGYTPPKRSRKKSRRRSRKKESESEPSDVEMEEDYEPRRRTTKSRGKRKGGKKRRSKVQKLRAIAKIAKLTNPRLYQKLKPMKEKDQIRHLEKLLDKHDIPHDKTDLTEDAIDRFRRDREMVQEVEDLNVGGGVDLQSGRPSRRNTRVDYTQMLDGPKLEFPSDEEVAESEPSPEDDEDDEFIPDSD